MAARVPAGLAARGRKLWRDITTEHDLSPMQREMLLDACRTADVLERLAREIDGGDELVHVDDRGARVAAAVVEYRQQSQSLKQLLVALRLPDEVTGKRPQLRSARGAQAPKGAAGTVSTLDRLRRSG